MYKSPTGKIIYPEDIECVHDPVNGRGGIWIGNLQAAQNLQTLKKNNIKAILTAAKGVFLNHQKSQIPYQLYIPGEDHQKFEISKFFNQSISFIRDTLQKTNILVHCLAGVSRSVSLVMAYFIKYHNMSYDNVYSKIKSRRKIVIIFISSNVQIHPNDGFIGQLKKFQSQCRERDGGVEVRRREDFSQMRQMRVSYSPSKRYERKAYYDESPQRFYESPEKRYVKKDNEFRYSQIQKNDRYSRLNNMSNMNNNIRNPQLYKSYVQNNPSTNLTSSNLLYKRASMNLDNQLDDVKLSHNMNNNNMNMNMKYESSMTRNNNSRHEYKPLDSIQNRPEDINSEIDRKIAEIRKKYQQYTKHTTSKCNNNNTIGLQRQKQKQRQYDYDRRLKLQHKYTHNPNMSLNHYNQANQNSFSIYDEIKMKKMTSYNQNQGNIRDELYSSIRKQNNYMNSSVNNSTIGLDQHNRDRDRDRDRGYNLGNNHNATIGNRLRRLQSYQV